jgi:hypothetical protein
MSVEVSQDPIEWAKIIERVLFQVFYRNLGMVSLHVPMKVAVQSINYLVKTKGYGNWKWLLTNRVLVWENVPINNVMKIHVYVFGSSLRQKNTVLVRQGFWRLWFIEVGLRLFDESIIGRILAKI